MVGEIQSKELESILRTVRLSLLKYGILSPFFRGSAVICSDGRPVFFPEKPVSFFIDEAEEAEKLDKLVDLFRSCSSAVFLNGGLWLVQFNTFYSDCERGADSEMLNEDVNDLLKYIMPPPDSYLNTYKSLFNILSELISPNIMLANAKDPLEQVIKYFSLYLYHHISDVVKKKMKYVCLGIYDISFESLEADESVAYCTTIDSLLKQDENSAELVRSELKTLWDAMSSRIKDYISRQKDCDVISELNKLLDVLQDETERANELMQKYGIFRVAFPLD